MINGIIYLLKRFSWFKRINAKVTYELLAKNIPAKDWQFMNYGYSAEPNDPPITLAEGTVQVYPTQMYHYLAIKTPLEGKVVLEVGSGRGGGANYPIYCLAAFMDLRHKLTGGNNDERESIRPE